MDFAKYRFVGQNPSLDQLQTLDDGGMSEKKLRKEREEVWEEVKDLQEVLYAESKQSLLIVLQAMDAAGKDSTIEKLTRNMNAQGCNVVSFKSPSKIELAHDFLWRVHQNAPRSGDITIFNRSHYEDVLIVKVHGWAETDIIDRRYDHINAFESLLADRGTRVVKFMLNISPEYQLSRFKRRLELQEKNWKFNPGDLEERKHWDDYMQAFETAIHRCASEDSPWYVVPAENRLFRDLMIGSVVRDTLKHMRCDYPTPEYDTSAYKADDLV